MCVSLWEKKNMVATVAFSHGILLVASGLAEATDAAMLCSVLVNLLNVRTDRLGCFMQLFVYRCVRWSVLATCWFLRTVRAMSWFRHSLVSPWSFFSLSFTGQFVQLFDPRISTGSGGTLAWQGQCESPDTRDDQSHQQFQDFSKREHAGTQEKAQVSSNTSWNKNKLRKEMMPSLLFRLTIFLWLYFFLPLWLLFLLHLQCSEVTLCGWRDVKIQEWTNVCFFFAE